MGVNEPEKKENKKNKSKNKNSNNNNKKAIAPPKLLQIFERIQSDMTFNKELHLQQQQIN